MILNDTVIPFQLDASHVRGRAICLTTVLDDILGRHHYHDAAAYLLAEAITLAVTLGSMLKYDGIFTLQARGDGPVSFLVVDYTSSGNVRGYARFDATKLSILPNNTIDLLGTGYLVFTVDQGEYSELYQGIVDLQGNSLTEAAQHYFGQSEQLRTSIKLAIKKTNQHWHASAIAIQALPDPDSPPEDVRMDNGWHTAQALLHTVSENELLDAQTHPHTLLYQLFHEEQVRAYDTQPVRHNCRCSYARVENVVRSLTSDEIDELKIDGKIAVTCEFCNSSYIFDDTDIQRLHETPVNKDVFRSNAASEIVKPPKK